MWPAARCATAHCAGGTTRTTGRLGESGTLTCSNLRPIRIREKIVPCEHLGQVGARPCPWRTSPTARLIGTSMDAQPMQTDAARRSPRSRPQWTRAASGCRPWPRPQAHASASSRPTSSKGSTAVAADLAGRHETSESRHTESTAQAAQILAETTALNELDRRARRLGRRPRAAHRRAGVARGSLRRISGRARRACSRTRGYRGHIARQ